MEEFKIKVGTLNGKRKSPCPAPKHRKRRFLEPARVRDHPVDILAVEPRPDVITQQNCSRYTSGFARFRFVVGNLTPRFRHAARRSVKCEISVNAPIE